MIFDISSLHTTEKQYFLQHLVAPRPICFASTINNEGLVNLSPFSFFNLFSYQPPIVIFSPVRRTRNNTIKHTLENLMEIPEVVINMVDYAMVHQTSLASCEYAKGVDEFVKAGFTKEIAKMVQPPLVKESKAKLECKVLEIKSLGENGGAGQLVICEVLVIHINDELLSAENKINPGDLDLVARMGGDWYCHANKENLFVVSKPNSKLGIGIDNLPSFIRNSEILTGNDLAQLANVEKVPSASDRLNISSSFNKNDQDIFSKENLASIHMMAKKLIQTGEIENAWRMLLGAHN